MRRLIFIALILMACIVPAFAQDVTVTAPDGKAITSVSIKSNINTDGTFTFYFNNGSSVSGSWSYQETAIFFDTIPVKRGIISVGGDTATRDYVTPGSFYLYCNLPGHDFNYYNFTATRVVVQGGQIKDVWDLLVRADAPQSQVIKYELHSGSEIEQSYATEDTQDVIENLGYVSPLDEGFIAAIMKFAREIFPLVIDFITSLIYWIGFLFTKENLLLIIALFLSVPMAFAAKNSRGNPEKFFRQYFKSLRGFFEFVLSMWRMLIETIGTVRGWFRL